MLLLHGQVAKRLSTEAHPLPAYLNCPCIRFKPYKHADFRHWMAEAGGLYPRRLGWPAE